MMGLYGGLGNVFDDDGMGNVFDDDGVVGGIDGEGAYGLGDRGDDVAVVAASASRVPVASARRGGRPPWPGKPRTDRERAYVWYHVRLKRWLKACVKVRDQWKKRAVQRMAVIRKLKGG